MLRWKLGPGWARSMCRALVRGESTRGVGWGGGDAHKQATDRHRGRGTATGEGKAESKNDRDEMLR